MMRIALSVCALCAAVHGQRQESNEWAKKYLKKHALQPGVQQINSTGVLYRSLRKGSGTEHPGHGDRRPSCQLHMEKWALREYIKDPQGKPEMSTLEPPEPPKKLTTKNLMGELNVKVKEPPKPIWMELGKVEVGLALAVTSMVQGDRWEVVIPAPMGINMEAEQMKAMMAFQMSKQKGMTAEQTKEMMNTDVEPPTPGAEKGDPILYIVELVNMNGTRVPAKERDVSYTTLENSMDSLEEWKRAAADAKALVLGVLRQPTKGQALYSLFQTAADTYTPQGYSFAVDASSKWDHKINKFTTSEVEAGLGLKSSSSVFASVDRVSWTKCQLGRNVKTMEVAEFDSIIEACVASATPASKEEL